MQSPLSQLSLDYWYKVLVVVCFVVFFAAGAGLLKALPVTPTVLMSLGGFFIGIGEWINHPLQTRFLPGNAWRPPGMATSHPRRPQGLGIAFDVLGAVLICGGLVVLVHDVLSA